jgi:succinoglycan biosynthesis protein ExoV
LQIALYTDEGKTNFGDDLNRWLWNRLLGSALEGRDEVYFAGIGTVISKGLLPPNKQYIVLGSGVGYDILPDDVGGPSWEILAVRGPLTAKVLGLPAAKAVTDAAALLRLLPECEPLPESEQAGIVFMPHYSTLADGNWERVCELAGVTFLDPFEDSEKMVQRIRRAKLVIADAMHAAIVADALRVPWIPVALSPQSNTFKWLDWTRSLGLPYEPVYLGASTALEAIGNFSYRFRGISYYSANRNIDRVTRKFQRNQSLRSSSYWGIWGRWMFLLTFRLPQRILALKPFQSVRRKIDQWYIRRATRGLKEAQKRPLNLSEESVFNARLQRLQSLLKDLGT